MKKMHTLRVNLGDRTYPIEIGKDLFSDLANLRSYIVGQQALIVTNTMLADHPLLARIQRLNAFIQLDTVILPEGEAHKTLEMLQSIFDVLLQQKHKRSTTLLAFGGGVIGDMTGFAAACYQRGVNFIQIPTTLLAQVDSSVGGKTGVNHPLGKNMMGAFHQPQAVFIDLESLNTLPDREFYSGLAEIIKHGLIQDAAFFDWLCNTMDLLVQRDEHALAYAIYKSCEIKANIVSCDEREHGIRSHLNFGHTFAHAIETLLGYGVWLHGEAVAVGMMLAAEISCQRKSILPEDVKRIETILKKAHLPTVLPSQIKNASSQLLAAMMVDKKNTDESLRLIVLKKMGEAQLINVQPEIVTNLLERSENDSKE